MIFALDVDELMSYNGTREGWEPLLYIFDNYHDPSLSYLIGDRGSFNPAFIQELYEINATGQLSDNQFISKGDYGYNTSAMLPVIDEDGIERGGKDPVGYAALYFPCLPRLSGV